jgi:acyl transferase domain-containing protein/NADP-dependent 3-hydroxy acid dehydrogenase YdfG/acyl carrier protein
MDKIPELKSKREPIAIIGIGCRFPGAADLESLWDILRDARETVEEYPGGRFSALDRFYDPEPGKQRNAITRRGGFLKNLDLFDADFFDISPREAILLDPQHRLLLEVGWEALEDAGLPLHSIAGSRTGIFVGQWTSDFETCVNELLSDPHLYSTTGSGRYAAAARLAYHFDLRGPNLTLDTACSSSLVAVHLACQSLRSGESELALAGAVNLILRPEITLAYGSARMLSPDGRCKFADRSANGYVRSEAGAVVVLKLLERALADRDPIHAVIRGSATNNDGSSSGLLVSPGREGQSAMIRSALNDAGISAAELDYIEAHGTGTPAGDPAELEAIGAVLSEAPRLRPCFVGSVKTNIGHPEAAAGMAGLCKLVVSLKHALIPASLHLREPNPSISWSKLPLTINGDLHPWPHACERRFAGVNSFGITGTNAHVILENAPDQTFSREDSNRPRIFVLSARSEPALKETAAAWRERMARVPSWPASMADLAYTASRRRTFHPFRLAVVARDRSDLDAQLANWLEDEPGEWVHSGKVPSTGPRRVVFVFPGQGGQCQGMGHELFDGEPVFRDAMLRCDRALRPHIHWSVIDEMMGPDAGAAMQIGKVQPALFALMIALAELWRSWGVEPEAVVGHSMGEVAAAVVCGALSLEDGAAVISKRNELMKTLSGKGGMALTALTLDDAKKFVSAYDGRLSIGANNSPSSTVLSGDADAIVETIAALESHEIFCRRVRIDVASHSFQMDPIAPELERSLLSISPRRGRVPLYSTTTGCVEDGLSLNASYWRRNLREPVLFSDAVQLLLADGFETFIEINAHPVLLQAIEEGAKHARKDVLAVASQRRDKEQVPEILASLGKLHVNGQPIRFSSLYSTGESLRLPTYRWQRERYWPEESHAAGEHFTIRGAHPNVGRCIESSLDPGTHLCEVEFRPPSDHLEWAGWCLDLVVAASGEILDTQEIALQAVQFHPMIATADSGQLAFLRHSDGSYRFRLSAKTGETWHACCEGSVVRGAISGELSIPTHPVERTVSSTQCLIACLKVAAEALGYTDGAAGWNVSSIDRIGRSCGGALDQVPVRGFASPLSETCAHGELMQLNGSDMVRMVGVQFDFPRNPDCAKHIYQWKWVEIESPRTSNAGNGVFVIAGDAALSTRMANGLRSRNIQCVVVPDLASMEDAVHSLKSECRAVFWTSVEQTSKPQSAVQQVCDVSSLVRSITLENSSTPPSLWLITRGAHIVDRNFADPTNLSHPSASQAAVWGLARVIAREHPELQCISVDLSPLPDSHELELLERLASSDAREDQMAIRGRKCYGLRLERRLETDRPQVALREDGVYLITGGLGDLGLGLAEFLAERGAGQIVLVSRRQPDADALQKIALIESLGARVQSFQADVASYSEIASVLEDIRNGTAPLRGIFHLAGLTQDALLANFSRDSLEQVMRPKVFGSWNLHCLTADSNLDYFVMYSSVAAVCSQPGQGSYSAANAYMDGLATLRCACGLPGTSIQWAPWKNAGMARESGTARSVGGWAEQGIGTLSMETAFDGLHRLLAQTVPVAFVGPVDWKRFALSSGSKTSAVFSGLIERGAGAAQTHTGLRDQLAALPSPERAAKLESHLKGTVAAVLKTKIARIDSAVRFGSLGVDSLMAVEIARRITDTLDVRLPATALFNFPTLGLLSEEVARRLDLESHARAPQGSPDAASPSTSPEQSLPSIAQMTEEEALQFLIKAVEAK